MASTKASAATLAIQVQLNKGTLAEDAAAIQEALGKALRLPNPEPLKIPSVIVPPTSGGGSSPSPQSTPPPAPVQPPGDSPENAKAVQQINSLKAAVATAKAEIAKDSGAAALFTREAQLLQEEVRYKQQLAGIKDAGFTAAEAQNAEKLAAELNRLNVAKVDQEFQQASKSAGGFFGKLNQFVAATQEASQFALGMNIVSQQLGAAAEKLNVVNRAAFDAAVAFDSARAKVATITDDAANLANQMRGLSSELKYQQNSTELLNASYTVLSAGFSKTEDVAQVLKAASLGAKAGFTDLSTQVDATTTLLNAYGLSADQAAAVNDKLVATQNAGKLVLAQYAPLIGQVATQAAAAGISIDELNGFIATATAKGVKVESAVAGMRQAISAVLKPTAEAIEVSKQLNIQFDAQALKTKGLSGILAELEAKGAANAKTLTTLFGSVEAVTAILPSTGEGAKAFATNMEASANSAGLADKAAQKVADSLQGQLTSSANKANEALISLGNGAAKAILPLVQAANAALDAFNALPEPVKEGTGVVLASGAAFLTVASAAAGLAAIIPILNAGLNFLSGGQIALATATGAATVATGAEAVAATGATAALTAEATAAGGAAAATGTFAATALAAAAPLAVLIAAVGAAAFIKYTKDLENANEELDAYSKTADASAEVTNKLAFRIKGASDAAIAATKSGKGLTDEQVASDQKLISLGVQQAETLRQQLAAAQEFKPVNDEQKRTKETLIAQYGIELKAIEKQTNALKQSVAVAKQSSGASRDLIQESGEASAEYEKRVKLLDLSLIQQKTSVKTALADREISERDSQQRSLDIEQQSNEARLKLLRERIQQEQDLLASEQGKKGADRDESKINSVKKLLLGLSVEQAGLEDKLADNALNKRKLANDKLLEQLELANKKAEAVIRQSETTRTTQAKSALLSVGPGEDRKAVEAQVQSQILGIQEDAAKAEIKLNQKKLEQVKQLAAQKVISEKDATTQQLDLQGQIAQGNAKLVDLEIQRQEQIRAAILRRIELETTAQKTQLEGIARLQEAAQIGLKNQQALVGAQEGLRQAQASLAEQRVKQAADETQDAKTKFSLELELAALKEQNVAAGIAAQQQELALTQLQKQAELERAVTLAKIAELEAQAAIAKAKASGASQEEIGALEEVLKLRQQVTAASTDAIQQQQQIASIERQAAQTKQQAELEAARGDRRKLIGEGVDKGFVTGPAADEFKRDKAQRDATLQSGAEDLIRRNTGDVGSLGSDVLNGDTGFQGQVDAQKAQLPEVKAVGGNTFKDLGSSLVQQFAEGVKGELAKVGGAVPAATGAEASVKAAAKAATDSVETVAKNTAGEIAQAGQQAANGLAGVAANVAESGKTLPTDFSSSVQASVKTEAPKIQQAANQSAAIANNGLKAVINPGAGGVTPPVNKLPAITGKVPEFFELSGSASGLKEAAAIRAINQDVQNSKNLGTGQVDRERLKQALLADAGRFRKGKGDFGEFGANLATSGLDQNLVAEVLRRAELQFSDPAKAFREQLNSTRSALVGGGNSDIGGKLDTLNQNILTLARSPRSLTVMAPKPVQDAGQILADINSRQAVGAGLS